MTSTRGPKYNAKGAGTALVSTSLEGGRVSILSVFKYDSYRDYLRDLLKNAQSRNKSFSLRAYAQKLGVTPSFLSEVLQWKEKAEFRKCLPSY